MSSLSSFCLLLAHLTLQSSPMLDSKDPAVPSRTTSPFKLEIVYLPRSGREARVEVVRDDERFVLIAGLACRLRNVGTKKVVVHQYLFSGLTLELADARSGVPLAFRDAPQRPVVPSPPEPIELSPGQTFGFSYSEGFPETARPVLKSLRDGTLYLDFEKQMYRRLSPGKYRARATWVDPKNRALRAISEWTTLTFE